MSIKVILFGSTGMIGQGVLLECIDHPNVESVLLVSRSPGKIKHQKVKEVIHKDLADTSSLVGEFSNYNTCFFCLGVSAVGLSEAEYHKITYELTVGIAETLLKTGKEFTFCYISGAGTDSSGRGRIMWARVKGKLENALMAMPFKHAYMFRPGYIQPLKGIRSKTAWYNLFYTFLKPLYFLLKPLKGIVTDTSSMGKAMIKVSLHGHSKRIIESSDINELAKT